MLTILIGVALVLVIFIMFLFKGVNCYKRDLMYYEKCIVKSEHTEENCKMCVDAGQCIRKK